MNGLTPACPAAPGRDSFTFTLPPTMNTQEMALLRECLDWHKKPYFYFKDKYALDLLALYAGAGVKISTLKKSPWAFLLDKPLVKEIVAGMPEKSLSADTLSACWPGPVFAFTLGLAEWGTYRKYRHDTLEQTSRPGLNLVLQLNFGQHHNRQYRQLMQPSDDYPLFVNDCHPVNAEKDFTLAWARLDLDLDTGEVLVEEIQTDWLRYASSMYKWVTRVVAVSQERLKNYWFCRSQERSYGSFRQYHEKVLPPYAEVWDEAMLAAVIWFVRQELGIRRVYYHTFESGNRMKHITDELPPRSLYTKLPRRFGFRETDVAPQFICNTPYLKRKQASIAQLSWFVLDMP